MGKYHRVAQGECFSSLAHKFGFESFRAGDIAVNLIKKISGAKFPFPTSGAKNYADEELAAARQILAAILSPQRLANDENKRG